MAWTICSAASKTVAASPSAVTRSTRPSLPLPIQSAPPARAMDQRNGAGASYSNSVRGPSVNRPSASMDTFSASPRSSSAWVATRQKTGDAAWSSASDVRIAALVIAAAR